MTSGEPTEVDELSGRVLAIIGAYRMGAPPDSRDLVAKTATSSPPLPGLVPHSSSVEDCIVHVAR